MPTLVPSLCLMLQIPSTIPSMWALSHIAPPDANTVLRWHLGFLPQVCIFCYWSAPYKGLERYSWVMVLLCLYKDVFGWGKRNLYSQRNYCLEYISNRRNGVCSLGSSVMWSRTCLSVCSASYKQLNWIYILSFHTYTGKMLTSQCYLWW